MNPETVESRFLEYLDNNVKLSNLKPFLLTYIRLLLLFKSDLTSEAYKVILDRKKQILGENISTESVDEYRDLCRKNLDSNLSDGTDFTKEGLINSLIFCALSDSEETDFYYLTEPMFEFVHNMEVPFEQFQIILESEFEGLKL